MTILQDILSNVRPLLSTGFKAKLTCSLVHEITFKGLFVAASGFVFPSVVRRNGTCRFREYVAISGWDEGAVD